MKANELRIGNCLFVPGIDREVIVSAIFKTHYVCEDYNGIRFEESLRINYQPIPLTEEWFEKWGFYKDGEYWSKGIFDYKYCFKYRDWANNWAFYQEYTDSPNSKDDGIKYPISFDIQYVHQLQNLWYSLLHEEIEP
jgi:hypothetical protein